MSSCELRDDGGSSTVMALGLIAVLITATVAALAVLSAVRTAHHARSAADLAALAGAVVQQQDSGATTPCAEAERIALRHDVVLVACEVDAGGTVTVTTSAVIPHRLGGVGPERAEGRARAGPDPDDTGE